MQITVNLLVELRKRLMMVILVFLSLFSIGFYYSNFLFHLFMAPLQTLLTGSQQLIATQITAPLTTPLALASNIAFFFTTPFALWQLWRFAGPALYPNERRKLCLVLIASPSLFCLGCIFCHFLILPFMFQCMIKSLPKEVLLAPDIQSVAHFITQTLVVFGCSFQIPMICVFLINTNIINALRPYVIVIAFTLGMLLTPPDIIAQTLLALPLWGLYESGILLSRVLNKSVFQPKTII